MEQSGSNSKSSPTSRSASGGHSLPLLSSLHPSTTRTIVHQLLRECQAQRTLRSFLRRRIRLKIGSIRTRIRIRKRGKGLDVDVDVDTPINTEATSMSATEGKVEKEATKPKKKSSDEKSESEPHPTPSNNDGPSSSSTSNLYSSSSSRSSRVYSKFQHTAPCARSHFLFQALESTSLPIRQHACRILIDGTDTEERSTILCNLLWDMIQDEMMDFIQEEKMEKFENVGGEIGGDGNGNGDEDVVMMDKVEDNNVNNYTRFDTLESKRNPRHEGIIQLYGLMTHYLFATGSSDHKDTNEKDSDKNNGNGGDDELDDKNTQQNAATNKNVKKGPKSDAERDATNVRFYQFVYRGGLEWITSHVLKLINLLMQTHDVEIGSMDVGASRDAKKISVDGLSTPTKESGLGSKETGKESPSVGSTTTTNTTSTARTVKVANTNPLSALANVFSSPSVNKPRHYFTSTIQSRNISTSQPFGMGIPIGGSSTSYLGSRSAGCGNPSPGPVSEEEIKARLCLLVDFCLRITVLAEERNKDCLQVVYDYLWRKEMHKDDHHDISGMKRTASTSSMKRSTSISSITHNMGNSASANAHVKKISPLGSLLAASFILRSKPEFLLTADDYVMMRDDRLDLINWMLSRMVDVNGEIMVVPEEKKEEKRGSGSSPNSGSGGGGGDGGNGGGNSDGQGSKKRKRNEGSIAIGGAGLGGSASSNNNNSGSSNASNERSRRDLPRRLARLIKRQRTSTSGNRGGTGAGSSSLTAPDSTARALLRAVTEGSGSAGHTESGSFSTAADVMARSMPLSILERMRENSGDSSNSGGPGSPGDFARLMEMSRMGASGDGGDGDDDGDGGDDRDDEDDQDEDDDDDYGDEGKNDETEQEDGECIDLGDDEDEEEDDSMNQNDNECEEDDHEDGDAHGMDMDEEIESDEENLNGPRILEDGDDDDEDMLDNIIVEVASDPFQDDLMIVDSISGERSEQPLADILGGGGRRRKRSAVAGSRTVATPATSTTDKSKAWRSQSYLRASMELLDAQYPAKHLLLSQHESNASSASEHCPNRNHELIPSHRSTILTPSAEQALLQSICNIIKPPKKPLKLEVFMRRAPTQEEFFRGSLSKNPTLISSLTVEGSSSSGTTEKEPTVKDLRQHIANDLQMGDSAEMLELLVSKKILDMNLKLRVVFQTLWKTHVIENTTAVHSESSFRQLMSGSGLGEGALLSRSGIDENTPVSSLPAMVVTYRLAGVDGEATEDIVEVGDLVDPDAPPDNNTSRAEYEKQMEKEYGITRAVTKGRGVGVLLRSLEARVGQILQRIRRDDIETRCAIGGRQKQNASRTLFVKSPPCSTLKLLRHCAMLSDNRKKLVKAQAPTVLLRLLLDVLNSIDRDPKKKQKKIEDNEPSSDADPSGEASTNASAPAHTLGNNPTADALQELIETLSSDISTEMSKKSSETDSDDVDIDADELTDDEGTGASTLPMLLSSLRTTSLSPPLRKVIAKLLPFLTYGQVLQSRALAAQFLSHVHVEYLGGDASRYEHDDENKAVLMDTFVDTAIHLPPVSVCDTLRSELIRQGFVNKIRSFIISSIPKFPPPWSPALYSKEEKQSETDKVTIRTEWETYYKRDGLQTAFKILIGLSMEHEETQSYLANVDFDSNMNQSLLTASHWIESTSDKDNIKTNGLGILAETLLDTMLQNNESVKTKISDVRKQTRERKKQIAQERRSRALVDMSAFGRLVGDVGMASSNSKASATNSDAANSSAPLTSVPTGIGKSIKASEISLTNAKVAADDESKPAWLKEMEAMEDEEGLTCAVCQEGRTYQASEMLGLYAYMKKIIIPYNKGGGRGVIDGTLMLLSLPSSLPASLRGTDQEDDWYNPSMTLAATMKTTSHGASTLAAAASSVMSSRSCCFISTVTAGNAIHFSCHARARSADRNHPKAPKSEWEGASLRNSRVDCNFILPLMSKENSKIPVMEMENALADHQSAVHNMLGSKPKSMLWTVLHDVRLLLLRMAHDMLTRDAEHDSPAIFQHAHGLSTGFLAASSILRSSDFPKSSANSKKLRKSFIDAAPMAAICSILFQNSVNDDGSSVVESASSPAKRQWEMYKDHYLCGLLQCAGRRHALNIEGSGCIQVSAGRSRNRSSSFSEWNSDDHSNLMNRRIYSKRSGSSIEEYAKVLRPMIIFYSLIDQLSKDFNLQMDDEKIESCSERLADIVDKCQKADNIRTLISIAGISMDDTTIIEEVEIGLNCSRK